MIREHNGSKNDEFKKTVTEFEYCRSLVDDMLKEYKSISALAHIGADDRETLERKLKKYH
jgi:hypothetical protein